MDQPKQILKQAQDMEKQNDDKLSQIKTQHAALNKKRADLDDEVRMKRADADEDIKAKRSDLAKDQATLAKREADLATTDSCARKETFSTQGVTRPRRRKL